MSNRPQESVFIAAPCGADGSISVGTSRGLCFTAASPREVFLSVKATSALTFNFNRLWCQALNARKKDGISRFVMIHSDQAPMEQEWLDILLDELNETDADILSAVIPIKNPDGLTSTALDTHLWRPRRLTMTEIAKLPNTFDADIVASLFDDVPVDTPLLVNTGVMAMRIDRPWADAFPGFTMNDKVAKAPNGEFHSYLQPEDWQMSRWANNQGLKVMATQKVKIEHMGGTAFPNWGSWGRMKIDELNTAAEIAKQE